MRGRVGPLRARSWTWCAGTQVAGTRCQQGELFVGGARLVGHFGASGEGGELDMSQCLGTDQFVYELES